MDGGSGGAASKVEKSRSARECSMRDSLGAGEVGSRGGLPAVSPCCSMEGEAVHW